MEIIPFFFFLNHCFVYFIFSRFLFIYLFWLHWVLVVALGIFVVACRIFQLRVACGLLSCGMWTLSCGMQTLSCGTHAGSSSLTRDRTRAPCTGSAESYPLDHQRSPNILFLFIYLLTNFSIHQWIFPAMVIAAYFVLMVIFRFPHSFYIYYLEFF